MNPVIRRQTLSDVLHRSAARTPHKLAIVCGETRWTYAEFERISERVAAGLAGCGATKGTRVAILARNSHAFAAMRFALARLGAVLVPINFMLKAEEAAYIVGPAKFVFCHAPHRAASRCDSTRHLRWRRSARDRVTGLSW